MYTELWNMNNVLDGGHKQIEEFFNKIHFTCIPLDISEDMVLPLKTQPGNMPNEISDDDSDIDPRLNIKFCGTLFQ